jgi:endoglucanase
MRLAAIHATLIREAINNAGGFTSKNFRGVQMAPFPPHGDLDPLVGFASLVRYQLRIPNHDSISPAEYHASVVSILHSDLFPFLEKARARGIQVAVALMTPPGGAQLPYSEAFRSVLYDSWRTIAGAVIAAGLSSAVYGYDLLNEPALSPRVWDSIVDDLRLAVRSNDPSTALIVSSVYGDLTKLRYVRLLNDPNVIYTFHHYHPASYTHQDVPGFPPGPRPKPTRERIRRHLLRAFAWQKKHGVRLYVGEFSAIRSAPNADAYLRESIRLFNRWGWDWTYHAWREWHGWSLEHDDDLNNTTPVGETPRYRAVFDGMKA